MPPGDRPKFDWEDLLFYIVLTLIAIAGICGIVSNGRWS